MKNETKFCCNLTTAEFQKRKEGVIRRLKDKLIEKKELSNGYVYIFPGNDEMLDEVLEFIKAERKCCEFFNFKLFINAETKFIWLELTGEEGVNDFIKSELQF